MLAEYHAAIGHLEHERDGGPPYVYEDWVEGCAEQVDREIAEHDGVELDEKYGLEP